MGVGVAELVGVYLVAETRGDATLSDRLCDARVRKTTLRAQPKPRLRGCDVLGAESEIPIERPDGSVADGHDSLAAALTQDTDETLLEIDIVGEVVSQAEAKVGDLRTAGTGVEKDPDEGRISDAGVGLVGFAYADQRLEFGLAHDRWGCLG